MVRSLTKGGNGRDPLFGCRRFYQNIPIVLLKSLSGITMNGRVLIPLQLLKT